MYSNKKVAIFSKKTKTWLIQHLKLQLLLSAISLPLLVYNGLPISFMSLCSTLLFTPILTTYLFLSSVIFFFELFSLPNQWCIYLLEKITFFWSSLLEFSSNYWLYGFALPSMVLLLLIPFFTFLLLHSNNKLLRAISLSCLVVITSYSFINTYRSKPHIKTITCNNGSITLITDDDQNIIIDPGYIAQSPSACSWIQFNLAPEIIKQTGKVRIDHFVVLQPSARLFDALLYLNREMPIKILYLPFWDGMLPKNAWFSYVKLRETLKKQGSKILSTNNKPISITPSLTLTPDESKLHYHMCSYPSLIISGQIDNIPISIYAAKKQKRK